MSYLCNLEINSLLVTLFEDSFSHSVGCLFILLMVSFTVQKVWSLIRSNLKKNFVFIFITLGNGSKEILLWLTSKYVLPMFSSKSVFVSDLTFRCLIHFDFTFVYGVRECSNFILLHCSCPIFLAQLIEETIFSSLYIFVSFVIDWLTIGE